MRLCKRCGKPIVWIQMKSGKMMPCDPAANLYIQDPKGKDLYITSTGETKRGTISPDGTEYGRISHYATCPFGDRFRKTKKGAKESCEKTDAEH